MAKRKFKGWACTSALRGFVDRMEEAVVLWNAPGTLGLRELVEFTYDDGRTAPRPRRSGKSKPSPRRGGRGGKS